MYALPGYPRTLSLILTQSLQGYNVTSTLPMRKLSLRKVK